MADELTNLLVTTQAEGIARGLIRQSETGIFFTRKGSEYSTSLWREFSSLDKLMLAGLIGKILKETTDVDR